MQNLRELRLAGVRVFSLYTLLYVVGFFSVVIVVLISLGWYTNKPHDRNIVLLHVLFRSGDHIRTDFTDYAADPYTNETYFPFGKGELTNDGKSSMYKLGHCIGRGYKNFLGDLYQPAFADAYTTNTDRSKWSLQLVLAGMFPPQYTFGMWLRSLNWQPTSFNIANNSDLLLASANFTCPLSEPAWNLLVLRNDNVRRNAELLRLVSARTGWAEGPLSVLRLFEYVKSTYLTRFYMPDWMREMYPEPLKSSALNITRALVHSDRWTTVGTGYLLKKIIDDTELRIANQTDVKIHLYSGHQHNVAYLLGALGYRLASVPAFGASVILEIHETKGGHFVKVVYHARVGDIGEVLNSTHCGEMCPWEDFVENQRKFLPHDRMCEELRL